MTYAQKCREKKRKKKEENKRSRTMLSEECGVCIEYRTHPLSNEISIQLEYVWWALSKIVTAIKKERGKKNEKKGKKEG